MSENPFLRHLSKDRIKLSGLSPDHEQVIEADGEIQKALSFVSHRQLCDRALWKKFVEQYRLSADSEKGEWRCEYWGKMMRGAAFVYSVTKEPELGDVLQETVEDLLSVQDELGRFSTYQIGQEFRGWDIWGRKYILLGLISYSAVCDDEVLKARILCAMKRHADYIVEHIGLQQDGKLPIWHTSILQDGHMIHGAMNSLSVLEPMVLLYRMTKEARYLQFATYLVEEGSKRTGNIFELAFEDRLAPYQYPYTKAYEMMSCFEGLLEYAKETGNDLWKTAVINYAYKMAETDITILGGAGSTSEFLDHAALHQTKLPDDGQETCVTVTWMKFCSRMLLLTGDPLFADCFEQSLYNAYLGALNTKHIKNPEKIQFGSRHSPGLVPISTELPFDSYTPLLGGERGTGIGGALFLTDGSYYSCCASIASVGIGIAPRFAVLRAPNGFSIQYYGSGRYTSMTENGYAISFHFIGNYPSDMNTHIRISLEKNETMAISLHIPSWSLKTNIAVNGEAYEVTAGYTVIERKWKNGDVITVKLDNRVELLRPTVYQKDVLRSKILWKTCEMVPIVTEQSAEDLARAALRRGPLVLAADDRYEPRGSDCLYAFPAGSLFFEDAAVTEQRLADEALYCCDVQLPDSSTLRLIDSASAGKTWDQASRFCVWLKNIPDAAK